MGITGIDLIGPKQWHILKKYDLISSMCNGASKISKKMGL
jgi:hydroxypyruvate isomerase